MTVCLQTTFLALILLHIAYYNFLGYMYFYLINGGQNIYLHEQPGKAHSHAIFEISRKLKFNFSLTSQLADPKSLSYA